MRFEKGHKEKTRSRIIDVASKRFRKDGIAGAGLAGIMADAGLTNGAFYLHFESKEALVRAALEEAMTCQLANLKEHADADAGIENIIRLYLSKSHRDGTKNGCPSAALLPEIGRQSKVTRTRYQEELLSYISTFSDQLSGAGSANSKRRAMAIFSLMVGTLQVARAVTDPSLVKSILDGGIDAAMMLANASEAAENDASNEQRSHMSHPHRKPPTRQRQQGLASDAL